MRANIATLVRFGVESRYDGQLKLVREMAVAVQRAATSSSSLKSAVQQHQMALGQNEGDKNAHGIFQLA